MKRFCALALLGSLAVGQSAVAQSPVSLHKFTPNVLPVLVSVDTRGRVTDVDPSVELRPEYDRLLRQSLDRMITGPAREHGRPVRSQFVINLDLRAVPREDGKYDVNFVYVSTSQVPPGSWYWDHVDGHRLALRMQNRVDDFWRRQRSEASYRPLPVNGRSSVARSGPVHKETAGR